MKLESKNRKKLGEVERDLIEREREINSETQQLIIFAFIKSSSLSLSSPDFNSPWYYLAVLGEMTDSLITDLKSQLHSLRNRIQELESENTKLSSLVSNCSCHKMEKNDIGHLVNRDSLVNGCRSLDIKSSKGVKKKKEKKLPVYNTRTPNRPPRRYVALQVMYFGQRFYGFASEGQMDPTVESEIFQALKKTRLIEGDTKDIQYSRCGRTDKGVSAVGQVISLFVRSNHKEDNNKSLDEILAKEAHGEIDYVRILNRVLPKDIRVLGWCPASSDLSARFSCLSRKYKYFFWRRNLDIAAMEISGKKFIGEHDFRNFCKMDAVNVHNYRRRILQFEITPCSERFEGDELWAVQIKGTAFLWHQVRCMVAVLFMIGQGLESSNVIDALLDIDRTPRKPQYLMAPETPLVLQSCEFEDLKFMCSSDAKQALRAHLDLECRCFKLQAAIFHEALLSSSLVKIDASMMNNTIQNRGASHVLLMSRQMEPSYEERRAKLNSGTKIRAC